MTRPSGVIERPKILINGAMMAVELLNDLVDLRVETTVSRPAQATLRFNDYDFAILDDTKLSIGTMLDISFVAIDESSPSSIFLGEVTSLGIEAGPDDVPITVVTAQDLAHRLGRNSRQRVFANQTYADMVRVIARENGLAVKLGDLTIQYEHITQYVDDAAFITDICRRTGMIWRVDGRTLTLEDPELGSPVVELNRGENLRRFRAQFDSAEVTDQVTVRSWDPKTKQEISSVNGTKPASLTTASLVTSSRTDSTRAFRANKQTGANVSGSRDEATLMARSLHTRSMGDELRVRGEADGEPKIVAGSTIKIGKVGTKLSGNYFVTSAEHIYSGRDYVTRFSCGGGHPAKLADLVGGGSGAQHIGAVIGVVSNVGKDQEAGMVKVKLPTVGAQPRVRVGQGRHARRWLGSRAATDAQCQRRSARRVREW